MKSVVSNWATVKFSSVIIESSISMIALLPSWREAATTSSTLPNSRTNVKSRVSMPASKSTITSLSTSRVEKMKRSAPRPPKSESVPTPPSSLSFPSPPKSVSLPVSPSKKSFRHPRTKYHCLGHHGRSPLHHHHQQHRLLGLQK